MKSEDWQRVEELFHATLDLPPAERAAFLTGACAGQATLRAEVETLLAAFEERHNFMEQPALGLGLKVLSGGDTAEALIGKRIGEYQILTLLGKGGMGRVYLAEDLRLGRQVALKFISHKVVSGVWGKRQLIKEAQAVAQLDHPNICPVYGFEEADGHSFMVMQYVEGETLSTLIQERRLSPEQLPHLLRQIVSALAEAHAHGIIHRDIKPQNIIVSASRQVKVLDFGLAKLVPPRPNEVAGKHGAEQSSQLGLVIGTVAYMSPEQLRAERLDFRSDIFSLGVVLYEMLSGQNPFRRDSNAEVITAILSSGPPAVAADDALNLIAQKCLQKDREQRYQSANELLLELDNPPKPAVVKPRARWLRAGAIAALCLLLIVGAILVYSRLARVQSLAVLPIVNESAEPNTDYLSEGVTEGLINRLSRLANLRVKAPTVGGVNQVPSSARRQAGRELGVETILTGRLLRQNGDLLLEMKLLAAAEAAPRWTAQYRVEPAKLLSLQNDLCREIVAQLGLTLNAEERRLLLRPQTVNPEAYKMYLLGRHFWNRRNRDNLPKAIEYFRQAVEEDPQLAQAYTGLADSYVLLPSVAYGSMSTPEAMARARARALKALELDDTLCEAHTSMGVYLLKYEWNWAEAEKEFKRALSLDADYAPAHFWYANLLALTGRAQEAITESETAKDLDPFSLVSDLSLGRSYYYARQSDRAVAHFQKLLERQSNYPQALYLLSLVYHQKGLLKEMIATLERLAALNADAKLLAAAPLGFAYARVGRREEALEILRELEERAKQTYVPAQERAIIYVGLEQPDQAFALLQEACAERFASLPFLLLDPLLQSLRADPRFAELVRCANVKL